MGQARAPKRSVSRFAAARPRNSSRSSSASSSPPPGAGLAAHHPATRRRGSPPAEWHHQIPSLVGSRIPTPLQRAPGSRGFPVPRHLAPNKAAALAKLAAARTEEPTASKRFLFVAPPLHRRSSSGGPQRYWRHRGGCRRVVTMWTWSPVVSEAAVFAPCGGVVSSAAAVRRARHQPKVVSPNSSSDVTSMT